MPWKLIDMVLARRDRIAATMRDETNAGYLILMLLTVSLLFPVPFSLMSDRKTYYDVTLIYTGTLLICFPSLFIFSRYLEIDLSPAQVALVALLISACASILSLGWAPVIWFVKTTQSDGGSLFNEMTDWFLWSSLLLGFAHMVRTVHHFRREDPAQMMFKGLVAFLWAMLFWWIAAVMARTLKP